MEPNVVVEIQRAGALALRLNAADNVAVVTSAAVAGDRLPISDALYVDVRQPIEAGHKVALRDLRAGEPVRKFGEAIGYAMVPIREGEHVHTHNLEYRREARSYVIGGRSLILPVGQFAPHTFDGIRRADGRVATRNYIGILTTVNCSGSAARMVERRVSDGELLRDAPNVDGVVALTHSSGCCLAPDGEGLALLRRTLLGYARHPNFGGLVLLALGCEVNQLRDLLLDERFQVAGPFVPLTIQEVGGTAATVDAGFEAVRAMLPAVNSVRREPVPVSHLVVGIECGGSDAYSGLTANPAAGVAADILVRHGATVVFGETPEIYGAEHLLLRRVHDEEVGRKLIQRIRWWEDYTMLNGASMDNNPTPGNKAGGITTIIEKSLGAIAKGGSSDLVAVYDYAEPIAARGLVFMDTPGYDPVSVTGMVAGGANVICFTTGRGSAFGGKPVPSIKIASNSAMYRRMQDDMDINAGTVLEGSSVDEVGAEIFRSVVSTASGSRTRSEILGIGHEEFVPWLLGAVM